MKKIVPEPSPESDSYPKAIAKGLQDMAVRKKQGKRDQRQEAIELEKMLVEKLAISDEKYQSSDVEFEYDYIPRWDLRDETTEIVQANTLSSSH